MLLQTTFKKISILSRMQTQMWFHRNINKYQKTRYSSKYHPKETSFLHYTYPFFSKKMVKSTQFHPPFYSTFTFYCRCELWSSFRLPRLRLHLTNQRLFHQFRKGHLKLLNIRSCWPCCYLGGVCQNKNETINRGGNIQMKRIYEDMKDRTEISWRVESEWLFFPK